MIKKSASKAVDVVVTQLEPGGAQKAAIQLSNNLAARGYRVRLIFFFQKTAGTYPIDQAIEVKFCSRHWPMPFLLAKTIFSLVRMWSSNTPDCIISFTHYANVISAFVGRIFSIPTIVSHRNPLESYPKLVRFIDPLFFRAGLYSAVTYVSRTTRSSFSATYPATNPTPHEVIYNGCRITTDWENHKSSPQGYVVAVGRLVPQKNHMVLIEALARSKYSGSLLIIGDGPLHRDIIQRADELGLADRVSIEANLSNEVVQRKIAGSDAFLMPSHFEGMSNALLEALCIGTKIIISRTPSQEEAVTLGNSVCAKLCRADSPDDWAEALSEIDNQDTIPPEIVASLRGRHSYAGTTDQFERLITSVLGKTQECA